MTIEPSFFPTADECRHNDAALVRDNPERAIDMITELRRVIESQHRRAELAVHEATTTRAALHQVRELLNSTKSWHTYEPRELGEAYLADTVNDFIDDLAAALSSTNTTHNQEQQ